jgi:hypothetical protein
VKALTIVLRLVVAFSLKPFGLKGMQESVIASKKLFPPMIICGPFGHHPYTDQRKSEEADTKLSTRKEKHHGRCSGRLVSKEARRI